MDSGDNRNFMVSAFFPDFFLYVMQSLNLPSTTNSNYHTDNNIMQNVYKNDEIRKHGKIKDHTNLFLSTMSEFSVYPFVPRITRLSYVDTFCNSSRKE